MISDVLKKEMLRAIQGEYSDLRLPLTVQKTRVSKVVSQELTETQRLYLSMYLDGMTQADIAETLGVSRSTVCRTLRRTFDRLRRFLRY